MNKTTRSRTKSAKTTRQKAQTTRRTSRTLLRKPAATRVTARVAPKPVKTTKATRTLSSSSSAPQPHPGSTRALHQTRDAIADIWGPRTPHFDNWPERVDERTVAVPDRWVQSACVLCSNGCALDIGVKGGKIVGVRGRGVDRVNHGRLGPTACLVAESPALHRSKVYNVLLGHLIGLALGSLQSCC